MGGDRAVAQEAIEIETFVDIERQALPGAGASHAGRCCQGRDPDDHPDAEHAVK
jgi:hypothetical protein